MGIRPYASRNHEDFPNPPMAKNLSPPSLRLLRLSLLLTLTAAALAARADFVTLSNGDRISGSVESLADGKLSFKTSWAGSIQISWEAVAVLESDETFAVKTTAGEVYSGSLRKAESTLSVRADETTRNLDLPDIASITPAGQPEPGFWEELEGGVDFGYSLARGNSNTTQSSFSANANYEGPEYKVQGKIVSILSEPEQGPGTSRHTLDTRYDRFLSKRSFVFVLGGLERNEQQLLNLRTKVGGGVGRKLINADDTTLSLLGGVDFANERFRPGGGIESLTTSNAEALAGFDFKMTKFAGIEFTLSAALHPTLTDGGRYRIEADSGFRIPIAKSFTWGLSLYDRFDSRPPVPVQRNDYGLLSTLGFKF